MNESKKRRILRRMMVYESYEGNMEDSNEEDDRRIYNKD